MRPEHPPGCTATRSRRSSRPSWSSRLFTFAAAASVRPTPCAFSAVVAVVVAVAGVKAWTILQHFLGLRSAPGGWRALFAIYLIALSGAIFAIYTAGTVLASRAHAISGSLQ